MWTIPLPDDSVEVDLDDGEAELHLKNVCSVFDAFTVANSFDPAHALGFVGGKIDSLRIKWHDILRGFHSFRSTDPMDKFAGDFFQTLATIEVTASTRATEPPFTPVPEDGFRFVGDPTTTQIGVDFAQIGHERNGVFFT